MVLRCDDCISYHVAQCKEAGVTREEFFEVFSVGLVVGGSIVIPHLRRAVDFLDQLESGDGRSPRRTVPITPEWDPGGGVLLVATRRVRVLCNAACEDLQRLARCFALFAMHRHRR